MKDNKDVMQVELNPSRECLWTIAEVAQYLRLEPETVRTMARKKVLPGFKVERVWRFRRSDVEEWVSRRVEQSGG